MQFRKKLMFGAVLSAAMIPMAMANGQFTVIQTGDFHGHLTPRPNLRATNDAAKNTYGEMVGGLARVKTQIDQIRQAKGVGNTLLLHTGDTIQGSGEVQYTRGQAIVDVVDLFGIDGYAPGNWDYVYGPERFKELFATNLAPTLPTLPEQTKGKVVLPPDATRWGGLVSNLYLTSVDSTAPARPTAVYADDGTSETLNKSLTSQDANVSQAEYDNWANWYVDHGQRVLPPYRIKIVNGVKVGIIGCTTSRGPQVVGSWVTAGLEYTDCSREVPKFAKEARANGAEVVLLITEIEIGRNIAIMKNNINSAAEHVDLILNSDMHEEPMTGPIVIHDKQGLETRIMEAGQDGTLVNEITINVSGGKVSFSNHVAHRINDKLADDPAVAAMVAKVRAPFNAAFDATIPCSVNSPYVNPFSVMQVANVTDADVICLEGPLDEVIGHTEIDLHRSNYSHQDMAAVIEGSSHDLIADAMRWWGGSDLATVRGFRYGTQIAGGTPGNPGAITRNDIYHLVPIGARIGKAARVAANQLRNQIDNSSRAVFSSDTNTSVIAQALYNNTLSTAAAYPGAGLATHGAEGSPSGWGGGWLFAYSGEGFHMNFAPYYAASWQAPLDSVVVGSGYNALTNTTKAQPPKDTSRARSLTVSVTCAYLPPAEQTSTGCSVTDTETRYQTVITTANNGSYTAAWKAPYPASASYTPVLLNASGWQYLNGTPNQPTTGFVDQHFKAGLFTVSGYWYAQSPNTMNNCKNCYPTGKAMPAMGADGHPVLLGADGQLNPDYAYLLPLNAKTLDDGSVVAALDANKNPELVKDAAGNLVWSNGMPKVAGRPIALTEIIQRYLAAKGTINAGNLPVNRIGLVNNDGSAQIHLPDFSSVYGFPVMQPLCGTIGLTAASALNCLQ